MQKNKRKYVIIDFSASKFFTHHWSYIYSMATFLAERGQDVISLVPTYSSISLFSEIPGEVRYRLKSNIFGPNKKENFLLFSANHLIDESIRILERLKFPLLNQLKILIVNIFLIPAIREIKRLSRQSDVTLVFTTVDQFALVLIRRLVKRKFPNLEIKAKLISGAETRGCLVTGTELRDLINLIAECEYREISFGFEVENYKNQLMNLGISESKLFWTPAPSIRASRNNGNLDSEEFCIGFLGGAKLRKGFDEIPRIIHQIRKIYPNARYIVQGTDFKWPGYDSISDEIKSLSEEVEFIDRHVSDEEYFSLMERCSLLLFPYDPTSYRMGASGVVYQAADRHIPVLIQEGCGFADECKRFQVGETYIKLSEIGKKVRILMSNNDQEPFEKYNENRNHSLEKFLGLDFLSG